MASVETYLQAEHIERVAYDVGVDYVRYKWVGPEGNTRGWYSEEELLQMAAACRRDAQRPLCPGVAEALTEMADFIEDQLAMASAERR